jgi:arylsulfatase A-like enzyme
MNQINRIFLATLPLLILLNNVVWADQSPKPNILVILTDDQGWGDLSLHGNLNLKTPNIDSIAISGARFEHFYVNPVCSPTRAEFLTGRYHARGGVRNVSTGGERLDLDEITLADYLKQAGYRTGAYGKWHNGSQYPYHPLGRGFQDYYGFTSGHWGDYFSPPLEHNGEIVKGEGFMADDITNHAISFMEKNDQNPFFCYLAYNTPHSPMQVPDSYYNRFKDLELKSKYHGNEKEDIAFTRTALAMCENLDDNIGRVLKKLDELKIAENTIVVYFHDNGPNGWRYNGGMRGRKGTTDEGGLRSPLFIRWPGKIRSQTKVERISGAIDITPTLLGLAGITSGLKNPLDGASFAPALLASGPEPGERLIFSHWAGKVSVRSQSHRLDDRGRLYDMTTDPGQTKDISDAAPETKKALTDAVANWRKDVLIGLAGVDRRPFTVGYRELPTTHLPARDARFSGNIKRSASAPNCSFLTSWRSEEDMIYWPVEIHEAGNYEMQFHHTIARENLGATIEILMNNEKVAEFELKSEFNPPLRGMENDRVPRGSESYVKDFLPLKVGPIRLPAGTGDLKIRAKTIHGGTVADLRGISLKLQ